MQNLTPQQRYYRKNKEACLAQGKLYYQKNREKLLKQASEYQKKRRATDPSYKRIPPNIGRMRRLRRQYGITVQDVESMRAEQQNKCLICYVQFEECGRKRFVIDHNHTTSKVRGLLCIGCNAGLGNFVDSPETLERAAEYIRGTR